MKRHLPIDQQTGSCHGKSKGKTKTTGYNRKMMNVSLNQKKKDNYIEYANLKRSVNEMKNTVQKCKNQLRKICPNNVIVKVPKADIYFLLPNSEKCFYHLSKTKSNKLQTITCYSISTERTVLIFCWWSHQSAQHTLFILQIIPAESDNMGATEVSEVYISFKSTSVLHCGVSTVLAADYCQNGPRPWRPIKKTH